MQYALCFSERPADHHKNMERQPNPQVCRRLFFDEEESGEDTAGPGDTDGHYIDNLEEEMRRDLQEAIQRWNFDFKNDVPLEGQWEWEPMFQAEPTDEQMEPHSETDQGA
jgi:hypothetical protein